MNAMCFFYSPSPVCSSANCKLHILIIRNSEVPKSWSNFKFGCRHGMILVLVDGFLKFDRSRFFHSNTQSYIQSYATVNETDQKNQTSICYLWDGSITCPYLYAMRINLSLKSSEKKLKKETHRKILHPDFFNHGTGRRFFSEGLTKKAWKFLDLYAHCTVKQRGRSESFVFVSINENDLIFLPTKGRWWIPFLRISRTKRNSEIPFKRFSLTIWNVTKCS